MDDSPYVALLLRLLAKVLAVGSIKATPSAPIFPQGYGSKGWLPSWLEEALRPPTLPCPDDMAVQLDDRMAPSMHLPTVMEIDETPTGSMAKTGESQVPNLARDSTTVSHHRYDYWLAKAVHEFDRYRQQDILFPTQYNVLTVASLDAVTLLQQCGLVPVDIDFYLFYAKPGHYLDVRLTALRSLMSLVTARSDPSCHDMMRVLFSCMGQDPMYSVRHVLGHAFGTCVGHSKAHRAAWLQMTSPTIFQLIDSVLRYMLVITSGSSCLIRNCVCREPMLDSYMERELKQLENVLRAPEESVAGKTKFVKSPSHTTLKIKMPSSDSLAKSAGQKKTVWISTFKSS